MAGSSSFEWEARFSQVLLGTKEAVKNSHYGRETDNAAESLLVSLLSSTRQ